MALEVGGRQWSIRCLASPQFLARHASIYPFGVLAAGVLISTLLAFYLLRGVRRADQLTEFNASLQLEVEVRRKAEQEVLENQNQLRALSSELSRAEESERQRIASYLHDDIGQVLALLNIKLGILQDALKYEDLETSLTEIREIVCETIDRTRTITTELVPATLIQLGLMPAIRQLTEEIEAEHGLQITIEHDGEPLQLDEEMQSVLYRGVRELLINVVKHAEAKNVFVSLRTSDGRLFVTVADDGVGFDVDTIRAFVLNEKGFGLFSLTERLKYAGGEVVVDSELGVGPQVILKGPAAGRVAAHGVEANEH